MAGVELKTAVDELVELVKKRKKISVEETAKLLDMNAATVQGLVDFLVEEKKLGVEYKFTTPYVYFIEKKADGEDAKDAVKGAKKSGKTKEAEEPETKEQDIRSEFYKKARARKLPEEKIDGLWKKYVGMNMGGIKDEFYKKAKDRNLPDGDVSGLWDKYKSMLKEEE